MSRSQHVNSAGLTPTEQEFVNRYIADGYASATAAYQAIRPRATPATAKREATRIMGRAHVKAYLAKFEQRVEAKLIERITIDRQWVLDQLVDIVHMAKAAVPVLDRSGKFVGEYRADLSVAHQALRTIGSELDMFIDKREAGRPGEFRKQAMTKDELRRSILEKAAKLGMSVQLPKPPVKAKK